MKDRSQIYKTKIDISSENSSWWALASFVRGRGKRILDVGCACGDFGVALKEAFGAVLVGLEYDSGSIVIARETGAYEVIYQCNLDKIDDTLVESLREQFDYIICGDILEHLREPAYTVGVLKGFLRDGGEIICSVPNVAHMYIKGQLLADRFIYTDTGLLDKTHIHLFTYHEIADLMAMCGLRIGSCKFTMCDKNEWRNYNPLDELSFFEKEAIFKDWHSYVMQYVFSAIVSSEERTAIAVENLDRLNICEEWAPHYIKDYRQHLLSELGKSPIDDLAAERDGLVAERNGLVAERNGLVAERDCLVAERDCLVADRDRILNSTCWKMTAPIRFLLDGAKAVKRSRHPVRFVAKQFMPYGVMVRWLEFKYGRIIDKPLFYYHGFFKKVRRLIKFILPYFLVMWFRRQPQ